MVAGLGSLRGIQSAYGDAYNRAMGAQQQQIASSFVFSSDLLTFGCDPASGTEAQSQTPDNFYAALKKEITEWLI